MPSATKLPTKTAQRKAGRPVTGITRTKLSITIPIELAAKAKAAAGNAESLSQFISRAIQTQISES